MVGYFGLKDKYVIKEFLKHQKQKQRKMEAKILPRPQRRPRKDAVPRGIMAEQEYEIRRLRMGNRLL